MHGVAELADGTLTSSKVKGLKNVVVLSDELLVTGVSVALAAVDWSTAATSPTDVTPKDDIAGVCIFGLKRCGSAAGSVTDVMSRYDMASRVPGCCTDADGVVISDSGSAFRGVTA